MIDWFVLLTPLLLLPIFLLFVFVGCQFQPKGLVIFGQSGDIPVPGDYFDEGFARAAFWRPGDGKWHIFLADIFTADPAHLPPNVDDAIPPLTAIVQPGDIPVPGDYLGKGYTQPAIVQPKGPKGTGGPMSPPTWYSTAFNPFPIPSFVEGDQPLPPGDYLGDGNRHVGFFRPSTRQWWIIDQKTGTILPPSPITFPQSAGIAGEDIPVPGDYVGDGRAQLAVVRPSTKGWFILDIPHPPEISFLIPIKNFDPNVGDRPLPPRFYELSPVHNGPAIFRPQDQPGTAAYYLLDSKGNVGNKINIPNTGGTGALPAPAEYVGQGVTEEAYFFAGSWKRFEIGSL